MRLVTANVEHALTASATPAGARRTDADALARALAALEPDVVALQEVDRGSPLSGPVDQVAVVAEALGATSVFAPRQRGGSTGVALLARGAIDDVATLRFVSRWGPPEGRPRLPLLRPTWRAVLLARVTVDDVTLAVTSAHLELTRRTSHAQLERVVAALAARAGPHALLGDLNRRPAGVAGTVAATGLRLVTDGGFTHPRDRPVRRIDHVALGGLRPRATEVVDLPVGDHRALVVDVELTT